MNFCILKYRIVHFAEVVNPVLSGCSYTVVLEVVELVGFLILRSSLLMIAHT